MSILQWCARVGATYAAIIAEVATTAETGHRELVVVTPPNAPIALALPHRVILSTASVAVLFRGDALENLSFPAPPSYLRLFTSPVPRAGCRHVYNQFVVRVRDQ
jgi:hypothetical protein